MELAEALHGLYAAGYTGEDGRARGCRDTVEHDELLDGALEWVLTILVVEAAMPRRGVMPWPKKLLTMSWVRVVMSSGVSESPAREDTSTSRFKELYARDDARLYGVQSGSGARELVGWV